MRAEEVAHLQAMVDTTDPQVTPANKLRAIELLAQAEESAEVDGAMELAKWLNSMSDAEVEKELCDLLPGEWGARSYSRSEVWVHLRARELDAREAALDEREAALRAREAAPGDAPGGPNDGAVGPESVA